MCVLAVALSRRHTSPSTGETASTSPDVTGHDLSPTPRTSVRPVNQRPASRIAFESGTDITSPVTIVAAISNELRTARQKLSELRDRHTDKHPDVEAQLRAIESLERSALANEPSELSQARAELAKLEVRYSDDHPAVQSQLRKIVELER